MAQPPSAPPIAVVRFRVRWLIARDRRRVRPAPQRPRPGQQPVTALQRWLDLSA